MLFGKGEIAKLPEVLQRYGKNLLLVYGGGSTIDCSKVTAAGYYYDGDVWDLVLSPSKIGKVLPIVTVLTIAATGSEMNKSAIVSKMDTNEKIGTASWDMIPKITILDPEYTYSVPAIQTASGAWTCHPIEHELSAFYDITHGIGLAILTPRWMRYILSEETVDKFVD